MDYPIGRPDRTGSGRRHVCLAVCLGVVVTAIVRDAAGPWQTRRGDEEGSVQARWDAAGGDARWTLKSVDDAAAVAAGLPRRVELRGEFLPAATVFIDNRALNGVAGFQVVTPLRVHDGSLCSSTAAGSRAMCAIRR